MKTFLSTSTTCHSSTTCEFGKSIKRYKEKEKKRIRSSLFFILIKFVPCADIGMKTRGYGRIMYKLHAWSLLAEFVWAKTKDFGETIEGAYISFKYGTF